MGQVRPFLAARFLAMQELSGFLLFPPLHTSPPSINLPAGKKSYLPAVLHRSANLNEKRK